MGNMMQTRRKNNAPSTKSLSRNKNPKRSKNQAKGKAGRQRENRARRSTNAGGNIPARGLTSAVQEVRAAEHPKHHSEATGTPLGDQTELTVPNSRVEVEENSVLPFDDDDDGGDYDDDETSKHGKLAEIVAKKTINNGADHCVAEGDLPTQPQPSPPGSPRAVIASQVSDVPAVVQKATKATMRAEASLAKVVETAKLRIEKIFKKGETKANHARVAEEASETKLDKITKAATANVDLAMRAGDVKIDRAKRPLQIAKANEARARKALQELLAMQQKPTAKKNSTRNIDGHESGDEDASDSDSSE
ncbi:MAG: hypothetical protein Q9169_007422 [Polycauliona sp. 2 TL-2023]